ncbi:MAG: AraC family transcriptional regulator [Clostridia bacterium]
MSKLTFTRPNSIINAQNQHKQLAVYIIDDQGRPVQKISELSYFSSEIFNTPIGILEPAIEFTTNNYNKDIKLETASSLCNLSPSYFSRLFSQTYNMSFTSYLISMRLFEAKKLLQTTNQTIISIAYEVGYVDNGYFTKLFKKHVGCTPLEYRKNEIEVFLEDQF